MIAIWANRHFVVIKTHRSCYSGFYLVLFFSLVLQYGNIFWQSNRELNRHCCRPCQVSAAHLYSRSDGYLEDPSSRGHAVRSGMEYRPVR